MGMDPDQGGPKTCGSGSATLVERNNFGSLVPGVLGEG
jgi:hypothetical protein